LSTTTTEDGLYGSLAQPRLPGHYVPWPNTGRGE